MARADQSRQQKPRIDPHQRQMRRNQIVFAIFSGIIILSMLLSMIIS